MQNVNGNGPQRIIGTLRLIHELWSIARNNVRVDACRLAQVQDATGEMKSVTLILAAMLAFGQFGEGEQIRLPPLEPRVGDFGAPYDQGPLAAPEFELGESIDDAMN